MREEIKIKELMIGNYLQCNSEIIEVAEIRKNSVKSTKGKIYKIEDLEPIKTTDEWLFRLGFDCWDDWDYYTHRGNIDLEVECLNFDDYLLYQITNRFDDNDNLLEEDEKVYLISVNKIHELQNAYNSMSYGSEVSIVKPNIKLTASIKFNSIKECREIEKKLIELDYEKEDCFDEELDEFELEGSAEGYICVNGSLKVGLKKAWFCFNEYPGEYIKHHYNSLEEFLNDEAWKR